MTAPDEAVVTFHRNGYASVKFSLIYPRRLLMYLDVFTPEGGLPTQARASEGPRHCPSPEGMGVAEAALLQRP